MAFKLIFAFIGLQLLASKWAEALDCYSCDDVGSGPCFDPTNSAPVVTCSTTTLDVSKLIGKTMSENFSNRTTKATDGYSCYKTIINNKLVNDEEIGRGCIPAALESTYCQTLSAVGEASGIYTVNDCVVCDSNLCNSGTTPAAVFISVLLSLLMTLTLF